MPRYRGKSLEKEVKSKKLDELYDSIIGIREDRHTDYTDEQDFLIQYYNMQEGEIPKGDFNFSNLIGDTYGTERISDDELQTMRYKELMNFESLTYFIFKKFYNREQIKTDRYHDRIEKFEQYLDIESDIEKNPTVVKKMRVAQLINRIAHEYDSISKKIIYTEMPRLSDLGFSNRKRIEYKVGKIFSENQNEANSAIMFLSRHLQKEEIEKLLQNKALRYCTETRDWMYGEKDRYIIELAKDLSQEDNGYNYGISEDLKERKMIVFDVPGYGQFTLHFGTSERKILPILTQDYRVGEFKGTNLRQEVYILSRPNMELVETVVPDLLNEEDRYLYDLVKQDPYTEPKRIREEKRIEEVIAECKDSKKARNIYEMLKDRGVNLGTITKMVLENGNEEVIPEIVKLVNDANINLEKCKSLLSINLNQIIEVYEVIDKLDELGIDRSILQEAPNFLRIAKLDRIAPIYEVLKKYKIRQTNQNMGDAFGYNAENIQDNLDLAIENGLYDFAQSGVSSFFSTKNSSLRMRMNLLKMQREELVVDDGKKRKINGTMFKTEKDLMKKYGITKKEVLDELSKVQGQELLEENEYASLIKQGMPQIGKRKQALAREIYKIIEQMETQKGVVLTIGDYNYSAIKVKRQLESIIENMQFKDVTDAQKIEMIKAALFTNKDIDKEEMEIVGDTVTKLEEKFRREKSEEQKAKRRNSKNKNLEKEKLTKRIQTLRQKIEQIERKQVTASKARRLARDEKERCQREIKKLEKEIRKKGKEK